MELDTNRTYKVFHSLLYQGKNAGMFSTDLQWDEGAWYLVFDWTTNHDGEFPSLMGSAGVGGVQLLGVQRGRIRGRRVREGGERVGVQGAVSER